MYLHRARRLNTTIFLVLALLFSQLALANFVCGTNASQAKFVEASVMEMQPGIPCEEMTAASDTGQSVLCHQHCVNAPQTIDQVKASPLSLLAVLDVFVVALVLNADAQDVAVLADAGEFRPPPDPIFLSTLRLRV
jgi:hypothetical protein